MKRDERDYEQLHLILHYCNRLHMALERFAGDYEEFLCDSVFQDSCSLCIIQIGEAVHRLSDEFKTAHLDVDWARIYGMRCHLVHGYEMFDAEIVWDAITTGIPPLEEFCRQYVASAEEARVSSNDPMTH